MKYKAVIIGCGNIAGGYDERKKDSGVYTHAGAYKKSGRIDLIAAADTNETRLKEFARLWNVKKTYTNYKEMLKFENADIISICVPDELHEDAVVFAAKNSKAKIIFCEKPISTNTKSARRMIDICRKNGKILVVDYQRRWEQMHNQARKMISDGTIGNIQGITGYYVKGLRHNGSTLINTIRFLVGDPEKMYAIGSDAVLVFSNKSKAFLINADKNGYGHSAFEIDIMGDKGRIRFSENSNVLEFFIAEDYRKYPGFKMLYPREKKDTKIGLCLAEGINEMADILEGKKSKSTNSGEEALKDLEIIEEIEKNNLLAR